MAAENDEILIRLGKIIRQLRKDQGLTLMDIEVACKINEGDLSKIENGRKNMNITTFLKLAIGLDMPASKILVYLENQSKIKSN